MDREHEHALADSDIAALAQRYLDGELTAEQHLALTARLRSDAAAQSVFVRSLMQTAYLAELLAQQRSADNKHGASSADLAPWSTSPPAVSEAESTSPSAITPTQPWGRLLGWGGLSFAALATLAVLAVLFVDRGREVKSVARAQVEVAASDPASEVFDPRVIHLESGSAKITLPKVGYMLVDGPADVELIAPLRAKLTRGRIRVRVTQTSGQGFVVETPDGEVVDLSTEFGLEVNDGKKTGVVVFDGAVDLRLGTVGEANAPRIERLVVGEGVTFDRSGEISRIVSIVTGGMATFQPSHDKPQETPDRIIGQVSDNIRAGDLKNFYEIVPGGMKEDALTYADRPAHDWNGMDKQGMPSYLIGADYVKTFNDDKTRRDVKIFVTLTQPAKLFVLLDDRVTAPAWLLEDFKDTGDDIGLDAGTYLMNGAPTMFVRATGPGNSLDATFSIWEREVPTASVVTLGPNLGASNYTGMFAIAAIRLDRESPAPAAEIVQPGEKRATGHTESAK